MLCPPLVPDGTQCHLPTYDLAGRLICERQPQLHGDGPWCASSAYAQRGNAVSLDAQIGNRPDCNQAAKPCSLMRPLARFSIIATPVTASGQNA